MGAGEARAHFCPAPRARRGPSAPGARSGFIRALDAGHSPGTSPQGARFTILHPLSGSWPRNVRQERRNLKWSPASAAAAARRRAPGRRGRGSPSSALRPGAHARPDRGLRRPAEPPLSQPSRNCQAEPAGGYWLRDTPRLLPESGSLYFGRISLNSVTKLREGDKFPQPARRRGRGEGSPTFPAAAACPDCTPPFPGGGTRTYLAEENANYLDVTVKSERVTRGSRRG